MGAILKAEQRKNCNTKRECQPNCLSNRATGCTLSPSHGKFPTPRATKPPKFLIHEVQNCGSYVKIGKMSWSSTKRVVIPQCKITPIFLEQISTRKMYRRTKTPLKDLLLWAIHKSTPHVPQLRVPHTKSFQSFNALWWDFFCVCFLDGWFLSIEQRVKKKPKAPAASAVFCHKQFRNEYLLGLPNASLCVGIIHPPPSSSSCSRRIVAQNWSVQKLFPLPWVLLIVLHHRSTIHQVHL